MDNIDLNQIRDRLQMLERFTRSLRLQIEQQWLASDSPEAKEGRKVCLTGLERFIGTANEIPQTNPEPYEQVFPDVWFGFKKDQKDLAISVQSLSYPPAELASSSIETGASSLIIDLENHSDEDGIWATLETGITLEPLLSCQGMEVSFIWHFLNESPYPLEPIGVQLGLRNNGTFESRYYKSFPAVDMPLELSYKLTAEQMLTIPRTGLDKATLIFVLPIPKGGKYRAVLSHMQVMLLNRVTPSSSR